MSLQTLITFLMQKTIKIYFEESWQPNIFGFQRIFHCIEGKKDRKKIKLMGTKTVWLSTLF